MKQEVPLSGHNESDCSDFPFAVALFFTDVGVASRLAATFLPTECWVVGHSVFHATAFYLLWSPDLLSIWSCAVGPSVPPHRRHISHMHGPAACYSVAARGGLLHLSVYNLHPLAQQQLASINGPMGLGFIKDCHVSSSTEQLQQLTSDRLQWKVMECDLSIWEVLRFSFFPHEKYAIAVKLNYFGMRTCENYHFNIKHFCFFQIWKCEISLEGDLLVCEAAGRKVYQVQEE